MDWKEAIQILGCTRSWLCRHRKSGRIRTRTVKGRCYDYNEEDVQSIRNRKEERLRKKHERETIKKSPTPPGRKRTPLADPTLPYRIAEALGYDLAGLRSDSRCRPFPDQRRVMALLLSRRGLSYHQIGGFLHRADCSIAAMFRTSYLVDDQVQVAEKMLQDVA